MHVCVTSLLKSIYVYSMQKLHKVHLYFFSIEVSLNEMEDLRAA
jgi:hypothetical protein